MGQGKRKPSAESDRLAEADGRKRDWRRWGTYLPERQWGTVREDYSPDGDPWNSFTHDAARYRAYRWGEDGLLGWTDRHCRICYSTSLWNSRDPALKERLFGLTNPEGNHGEDVKECYYYLDATPTHSYAKALYKYPHAPFPYADLRETNAARGFDQTEYELIDTGAFDGDRYFDVTIEYAKADAEDTLIRITIVNRAQEEANLAVLPTLTLRNVWSWRSFEPGVEPRPSMRLDNGGAVVAEHAALGRFRFHPVGDEDRAQAIFTDNNTNQGRLDPSFKGERGYSKDAFDRYLLHGEKDAIHPEQRGSKAAYVTRLDMPAGAVRTLRFRLVREDAGEPAALDGDGFDRIFATRASEADAFYQTILPETLPEEERAISRQAYAGLLWSKQFYYYVDDCWGQGGHLGSPPPEVRAVSGSNDWRHLFCRNVISVPDKWEYPWFAAWDLAFQMAPMAKIDPELAKSQLLLLLREWYLHPNGQMPAYEYSFSDVNPPVHAFAVFQVYAAAAEQSGKRDVEFLERAFQKLLLNFTWWVNRNDADGRNLFGGGFLGLDNIGVFDRNMALPDGVSFSQADATAWMGLFCAAMLRISVELAQTRSIYEDIAIKFFGHYLAIIDAMNTFGGSGLWDDEQGFYFDQLAHPEKGVKPLKIYSIVGLAPLFGIVSLRKSELDAMPDFRKRMEWFLNQQTHLGEFVTPVETDDPALAGSHFLSLVPKDRLKRVLSRLFDEDEFLSAYGVRSMSKRHEQHPYELDLGAQHFSVRYAPAEGDSGMFGGNSNWRGPVWVPINGLLVNSLLRYFAVYGEAFTFEAPGRSGRTMNLREAALEIARRLGLLFLRDGQGGRPCHGDEARYRDDPHWRELVLFYEYFCGDTGRGLGASHQTGWTALIATLLDNRRHPDSGMF